MDAESAMLFHSDSRRFGRWNMTVQHGTSKQINEQTYKEKTNNAAAHHFLEVARTVRLVEPRRCDPGIMRANVAQGLPFKSFPYPSPVVNASRRLILARGESSYGCNSAR